MPTGVFSENFGKTEKLGTLIYGPPISFAVRRQQVEPGTARSRGFRPSRTLLKRQTKTRGDKLLGSQLVKKGFDKLVDGEASSPARCRASNLRFEPSAVSPKAKPENPKGFQPPCHPHQSPLKIKDFSGAETARKRFFLWKMGFSGAKIAPCPRCIFALPFLWKSGSKWSRALPGRKGCAPLELSRFLTS